MEQIEGSITVYWTIGRFVAENGGWWWQGESRFNTEEEARAFAAVQRRQTGAEYIPVKVERKEVVTGRPEDIARLRVELKEEREGEGREEETFESLVKQWRAGARWLQTHGYEDQADNFRYCADTLEETIQQASGMTPQPERL